MLRLSVNIIFGLLALDVQLQTMTVLLLRERRHF